MGRRSTHTPEQLRALIISAAREIIAANGLSGVSAREIARKIGYSPGTLYNLFEGLDDLFLHVEALLLDALDGKLEQATAAAGPKDQLRRLVQTYTGFCRENPNLYNMITQHGMPRGAQMPVWYLDKVERLVGRVEAALAPLFPNDQRDPKSLRRTAVVVWAGVHGIVTLSTTEKLASLPNDSMESMANDFVATYLSGLKHST
jgi:AcrR family transcriptional regulator